MMGDGGCVRYFKLNCKSKRCLAFVGLLLTLSLCACTEELEPPAIEILRPVRYVDVSAPNEAATRVYSGSAEADEIADISFKVSGTLRERPVSVGDRVASDAVLATLDSRDFKVAVREAEAQLTRAHAELRNAEANYERVRELYENDNVSKSELDSSRAGAESAAAQVRVARQSLANAQLQLSYTAIVAPQSCEVAETFFKANENVTSGQPIVRLNCGTCPDVRVSVPETQIASIKAGDTVAVEFGALGNRRFQAEVEEVGIAMSSGSSSFIVVVQLTDGCEIVRSGMAADVEFSLGTGLSGEHFHVPWVAVGEDRNGRYVYVLEAIDDTVAIARRRSVEVIDTTERGIVIGSGLSAGERIVTAGVRRISDGLKVTLFGPKL